MIGIPKFPSQPNNGVRRNFDAILSVSRISLTQTIIKTSQLRVLTLQHIIMNSSRKPQTSLH